MKIIPADSAGIAAALKVLSDGGVVAHATETCYGLACDLRNPDAVQKLFRIKNRPGNAPVSGLFSSLDEAKKYVSWTTDANDLARDYLPGPLTIILPIRTDAPVRIYPEPPPEDGRTLGVRISSLPLAQTLAKEFGFPISTTSANLHGEPNPYDTTEIVRQFSSAEFQPDLILDSGKLPPTPPSTVVDLTKKTQEIRRKGIVNPKN
jgi:L-threonylcarbamoyladenylate synthase